MVMGEQNGSSDEVRPNWAFQPLNCGLPERMHSFPANLESSPMITAWLLLRRLK